MNYRLKKWNRLEQMEQIRPCLIWNRWNRLEQTKIVGLFHPNSGRDLRKLKSGTDGTDQTAFSKNLINNIKIVVNKAQKNRKREIKNVYEFLPGLFRSICSINKCSFRALENSEVIA